MNVPPAPDGALLIPFVHAARLEMDLGSKPLSSINQTIEANPTLHIGIAKLEALFLAESAHSSRRRWHSLPGAGRRVFSYRNVRFEGEIARWPVSVARRAMCANKLSGSWH